MPESEALTSSITPDSKTTETANGLYAEFRKRSTNRQLLALAWQLMGFKPNYPCDNKTMMLLARQCGYRVGPYTVPNLVRLEKINAPKVREGRGGAYKWSESELVALLDALHDTRAFDPVSSIHLSALTPAERELHNDAAFNAGAKLSVYDAMTPRELLLRMVEQDNRHERYLMSVSIERRLVQTMAALGKQAVAAIAAQN